MVILETGNSGKKFDYQPKQHKMTTKNRLSRRKFIQTSTAAAIAAPFILKSCANVTKEDLNHASIGVGGMGFHDL